MEAPGPFAVAVSGGPDSMALMRLAASRVPLVLTVDHGLRAGSGDEARQVEAWAVALGLMHRTLCWTGEKPAHGIQAAAREARYGLLAEACIAAGVSTLLTGHTLDDQAETIAMRAAKGSGALGLAGMPSQTFLPGTDDAVRLVRPLIATRKTALVEYLGWLGQDFLTDPSNADLRFDRARLRAGHMDEPDVAAIGLAQRVRLAVEQRALAFLEVSAVVETGAISVSRLAFLSLEPATADLVLATVLRRVGGRPYPGTAAERARVLEAVGLVGFVGRTLAGTVIAPAGRVGVDGARLDVRFTPELGVRLGPSWFLPFAQLKQIGPDGLELRASRSV